MATEPDAVISGAPRWDFLNAPAKVKDAVQLISPLPTTSVTACSVPLLCCLIFGFTSSESIFLSSCVLWTLNA